MVKNSSGIHFSFIEHSHRLQGGKKKKPTSHVFPLSSLAWCEVVELVSLVCKGQSGGQSCTIKSCSAGTLVTGQELSQLACRAVQVDFYHRQAQSSLVNKLSLAAKGQWIKTP